jgi:beta-mannosidase
MNAKGSGVRDKIGSKGSAFALISFSLLLISALLGDDCGDTVHGYWKFRAVDEFSEEYRAPDYNDFDWGRVHVPGQWQRIPGLERHHGRGVYRFAAESDGETGGKRHHLVFNGVFYKARVFVNGEELGEHQGYFEPFSFDITDYVARKGRLALVVEVECLRERRVTAKRQMLGVFGNWDVIANWRNAGGIWAPVEVKETGPAWFKDIRLTTLDVSGGVRVRMQAEFQGRMPKGAALDLLFEPGNFDGESISASFPVGESLFLDREFSLDKAKVWNPWKRGFPSCYLVTAKILDGDAELDDKAFLTGFRTVEVKDDWHFFINGQPMYMKGNNYAPSHVYISETTKELVERDVEMMKEANYDMVRVHAHVDHPEFYNACDRAGLMVFQDAPLQWGYDHGVAPEFARQVKAMVRVLYNHPCIVLWSVHNEPLPAGYDRSRPNVRDLLVSARTNLYWGRPEWNYLVLDPELVKAVEEEDPYRPVNRGSGMEDNDFHQYLGWYGGEVDDFGPWIEKARQREPRKLRFATEFGAQSFPVYQSAIGFLPDDLKALKRERKRISIDHMWQPRIMNRYVPMADHPDLASYIEASQDYQSRLLKYYIERIRMMKYEPNYGCLAFLHNDSQPAVTWSVVDAWRRPKKSYYTVRDCFRDPCVMMPFRFAAYRRGETVSFPVYVTNDTLDDWKGCKVQVILPDGAGPSFSADLDPDMKAREVGSFSWTPGGPGVEEVKLVLTGPGFGEVINSYKLEVK